MRAACFRPSAPYCLSGAEISIDRHDRRSRWGGSHLRGDGVRDSTDPDLQGSPRDRRNPKRAGGTSIAAVWVKNRGSRDCTVNTRPWVLLGPFRYRVMVADAAPGDFGNAGDPERTWILRPGRRIAAALFFVPGSCDRSVGSMFGLHLRAGWGRQSALIDGGACKNGTGQVFVGSFQR